MKRVGIMTGGGDCAGLNAVIAAIVKTGVPLGYEFVGFYKGWEGILSPMMYRELTFDSVRGISHLGGTVLHTTNKGRFGAKAGEGQAKRIPHDILCEARDNLKSIGVDALIVIGGDGTLSGALQLAEVGVNVVGVPKTIDNDLDSTDRTFGFSTAVQVVADALDRIHTTASSHDRVFIVEAMGRHAGWIALNAGLAGGADAILMPEFDFKVEDLVEFLRHRKQDAIFSDVIVIAEGAKVEASLATRRRDEGREVLYGGVADQLMHRIDEFAPGEFEIRTTILGHMQRGGTPNAEDRNLAKAYGVAAMHAVHRERFTVMIALRNGNMESVPIADAVDQLKHVTRDTTEYKVAKTLGVFIDTPI